MVHIPQTADLGPDASKVIPPGTYNVRVENAKETASKAGDTQWVLTMSVEAPEQVAGIYTAGFKLFTYVTFSEPHGARPEGGDALVVWNKRAATSRMWRETVKAMGFTVEVGKPFTAHARECEGLRLTADVADDTYQGETRSKIKRLHKLEVGRAPIEESAPPIVDMSQVPF